MAENAKMIKKYILPLLPLRGVVMFPYVTMPFDVSRESSIKALEEAMNSGQYVFLVTQKDSNEEFPMDKGIYKVGTVCKIKQMIKMPEDSVRVMVEGVSRGQITGFTQSEPFYMVEVLEKLSKEKEEDKNTLEALKRIIITEFKKYLKLTDKIAPEFVINSMMDEKSDKLCDIIAFNIFMNLENKQMILSEFDITERMKSLQELISEEIDILTIEKDLSIKVKTHMDQLQKEYFLREQIKVIQNELGDKESIIAEVEEYTDKLYKACLPKGIDEKARKELDKLSKMAPNSPEGTVIRNYLDWIIDIPWSVTTEDNFDLEKARRILDEDHYGLDKIKERIVEFLAVRKLKNSLKGPIICFVGPPGVGKTSIAKSISRALGRNYVRMSLGGIKDEAEIRGHRKTYIGAMPGRIITALKQAKSMNPVILLDEIDKLGSDYKGDPASALLEVLDGEQNFEFRDHYIELPVDLSHVLFITTANSLDTIPRPLLDRMEVIELSGYTEEEKLNIAMQYLVKKQKKENGIKNAQLKIEEDAVRDVINYYTRESGVRTLERTIGKICRKVAAILVSGKKKSVRVNSVNLQDYLGKTRFSYDKIFKNDQTGVATGLAWTSVGGDTLTIEVNIMCGTGKIELTGNLGDVMKESARAAISYIRSKYNEFNIDKDYFKTVDIHIHVPEGATPKDGPSAGITLATSIVSAITGIPVRKNVAMTGEITIRGRILPIGGLKEKVLAARRAGIDTVLIPAENVKDLDEIPDNVKEAITFITADSMDVVLKTALVNQEYTKKATHDAITVANVQIPVIPVEPTIQQIYGR